MLYPIDAKYPTLHEEVIQAFSDVQLEYVACESCGVHHPPELHVTAVALLDDVEPEEA